MARTDRLVSPSERIHLVTREHGVVLMRPFLRAGLAVLLFGGLALEASSSPLPAVVRWAVAVLAGVVVSLALVGLLRRVGRWNARRLVVTDRRVLLKSGTLSRRVTSVPLHALHDLQIHLSGAGRVLRYGAVIATANGSRGPLLGLRRLPEPDLVYALLLGLEDDYEIQPEPPRLRSRRAFSGV
jgi:uncharacterized membrane protein YdbT with pleckstrin-like domain